MHVDFDLYSSTRVVLEHCGSRLVPGSIIVFDEYFNYPGWPRHEHLAWTEFTQDNNACFEYIGFVPRHQQVAVRVC